MNAPTAPTAQQVTPRSSQYPGAPESPESIETFPLRSKRPGQVGLANEARPGRGTRADEDRARIVEIDVADVEGLQSVILPPPETAHEPSEQDSDSLAQELQRDTGVSGHSGGN
ncbi:MAG: hypothetical protein ABIZ81_13560 [Opitutaceae bacterium]